MQAILFDISVQGCLVFKIIQLQDKIILLYFCTILEQCACLKNNGGIGRNGHFLTCGLQLNN